jgi:predicted MFS family arabinose efflux permease
MLLVPLGEDWQPGDLAWRLAVVGVGFGLFVTPIQSIAMTLAPRELLGTTSASTNLARQLGIAVGPALGTAAWAASGYALDGMRAAFALSAGLGAAAVLALTRTTARGRRSPQLASCADHQQ